MIWRPIFITGFSDVIGSWKIMAISVPQTLAICFGVQLVDLAALEPHRALPDGVLAWGAAP